MILLVSKSVQGSDQYGKTHFHTIESLVQRNILSTEIAHLRVTIEMSVLVCFSGELSSEWNILRARKKKTKKIRTEKNGAEIHTKR